MNFYNENDPKAVAWLRELIHNGHIPAGVVDERSIEDIVPSELERYTQCHFFAGIGGWSLALKLAGWPEDQPVWTGSCPCQPFSVAGKGEGFADERHLWPAFHHVIRSQRTSPIVFGEQVASGEGLAWLDLVRDDLEASGYAFGAADLCAASVGAPHIRQRLWWVADPKRNDKREKPCCRQAGRVGWEFKPVSWNEPWQSALRRLRVVDDGLSYGVAGCNGPRNAIVPQVAAEFIKAYCESVS